MKILLKVRWLLLVFLLAAFASCVTSTNTSSTNLPDQKKTELGLYLTATEAYDLLQKDSQNILFVDVRTREEVISGRPQLADDAYNNIPYFLKQETPDKKPKLIVNHNFIPDLEALLAEKGLDKQSTVILICRQGNRSAKATNALAKEGYKKVYHVTDGANGWKNSDLPWTEPSEEQIQL